MFSFRLINLTIALAFLFFSFFLQGKLLNRRVSITFLIPYITIFFLVSRDGRVLVCFYRRVPLCCQVLLLLLLLLFVAKMYVLFLNVA